MEWVKLLAVPAYYIDGALLRAGEAAEVLFCRSLAYCGGVESGGVIDKTVLPMIVPTKTQARADALVREGLWLDEGTHYRVRSWGKWQDEHDIAAEKRRKDRERQREHRRKSRDCHADASRDSHSDKGDRHDVDVEGDVEGDVEPSPTEKVPPRAASRATRIPDVFPTDDEHREALRLWAEENTPAVQLRPETENWQDYHRAKGDTAKDWTASWRTWMRRAQKDTERPGFGSRTLALASAPRPSTTDSKVAQTLALAEQFAEQDAS